MISVVIKTKIKVQTWQYAIPVYTLLKLSKHVNCVHTLEVCLYEGMVHLRGVEGISGVTGVGVVGRGFFITNLEGGQIVMLYY